MDAELSERRATVAGMSVLTDDHLLTDQTHFDSAWEARERARSTLTNLAGAAAGPRAGARDVAKGGRELAEKLGDPSAAVAFVRIDDGEELTYVGKHVITNSDRDVLVVSWKSKAAIPYYKATIKEPLGLLGRRTFETKGNRILSFEDTVFRDLEARIEELTEPELLAIDDTLLKDLDKERSNEMRDIVQTIHATQYHLIERPLNELLVVQGGPGTGKTAVALHRVSWLLYNHADSITPEDILVIGPNRAFTQYIRSVLPALGDRAVQHVDLRRLGPQPSTGRVEDPETTSLKGELRMAELVAQALRNRVRPPSEKEIRIETSLGVRSIQTKGLADGIARLRNVPYAAGRNSLRTLMDGAIRATSGRPTVEASALDNALDRIWPSLTAPRFIQELLGSRPRLMAAAGDRFTARDIDRLYRPPAANLGTEEWSDVDVALIDEADWLINGSKRGADHIVLDEAQDLSPMQLRSVARRSSNGSFTVVGDVAQSTGWWAHDSWDDVLEALTRKGTPQRLEELQYGYRVPRQVYDVAKPLLPLIAPELSPPVVIRDAPQAPHLQWAEPDDVIELAVDQAQQQAGRGRFVGVIVPDDAIESVAAAFKAAEVNFKSASSGELGQSINLMSAVESKGLEFDAIVVVEPAQIGRQNSHGLRHLYIALTRTTKYLSVVYSEPMAEIGLVVGQPQVEAVPLPPSPTIEESHSTQEPKPSGRSARTSTFQHLVDTFADELAVGVKDALAPKAHAALVEALARRLDVKITIEVQDD